MALYSYKGSEPAKLPFRVRLDDGNTRTSLSKLTAEELTDLGFVEAPAAPTYDEKTQKITWNGSAYEIVSLSEDELIAIKNAEDAQKRMAMDYGYFWSNFCTGKVYKKLRYAATQTLATNIFCTELISLFNDAKIQIERSGDIQNYINILFFIVEITDDEKTEFQGFINDSYLDCLYTLPTADYLSTYSYHAATNNILSPKPFASWTIDDARGKWVSPIGRAPDLTDAELAANKFYKWDETAYQNDNSVGWVLSVDE
jgi:hypothetical protein